MWENVEIWLSCIIAVQFISLFIEFEKGEFTKSIDWFSWFGGAHTCESTYPILREFSNDRKIEIEAYSGTSGNATDVIKGVSVLWIAPL